MSSLSLLFPWGLASLAGLAVVGVVYLFYERYRERRITGLFLWEAPEGWREGGRKLARPRATRSLVLDLLAVLALALAVASPAWVTRAGTGTVVILDGSMSMRALGNHERAREMATDLVAGPTAGGSILVIEAGATPRVLAGPDTDPAAGRKALASYDPYDPSDSLADALQLGRELVTGHASMHVITDHDVDLPLPASAVLTRHVLAGRASNIAILEALRHETGTGETLLVVLRSFSADPQGARIEITGSKEPLTEQAISFAPGEAAQVSLLLPPGAGTVVIRLRSSADAIEADSVAMLVPEPSTAITAGVDLADEHIASTVRRALVAAKALEPGDDPVDLLVTDDPGARGALFTLRMPPVGADGVSMLGPFVVDRASPLCRDLDLTGVYWTTHATPPALAGIAPLVTVGDRPLFWSAPGSTLVLAIDPARSNVTRTPAWPVLISNVVIHARTLVPGLHRANYRPSEVVSFVPFEGPANNPTSIEGQGQKLSWRPGGVSPRLPARPGIYTLKTASERDLSISTNAIAPAESDLSTLSGKTIEKRTGEAGALAGALEPMALGWALVALAGLATLANWLADRRGIA